MVTLTSGTQRVSSVRSRPFGQLLVLLTSAFLSLAVLTVISRALGSWN